MTSAPSSPEKPERRLPAAFVEMVSAYPALAGLPEALQTEPEVSVRVNGAKGAAVSVDADRVPWCDEGFYLADRPAFTLDPALHQGLYYVQDASSMVMSLVAKKLTSDGRPVRWLDACAAPGGKSIAALSVLPAGSVLVSNEFDRRRAGALVENLERWGASNVCVTSGDAAAFSRLPGAFDVVAVDAPCSGEGMMRKEEVAVSQWSPRLIEQCAETQRNILRGVWQALRPGGFLVYSTCTFNTTEDEDNVAWLIDELGAENIDLGLSELPGVCGAVKGTASCARFIPGRVRGEGLFIAVLRRPGDAAVADAPSRGGKKKRDSATASRSAVSAPQEWLKGEYAVVSGGEENSVRAVPAYAAPFFAAVAREMHVIAMGTEVATVKGRDVIPAFALAHANDLNVSVFPTVEADYPTALAILRGEAVALPGAPRGIVLVTYGGRPLAFAKNLGSRANNLVPTRRRILSRLTPEVPPKVL